MAATLSPPEAEHLDAAEVLELMVERFHPRLTVACSFQKESAVILDLLLKIAPDARVFTLDTHVLFPETYETWRRVEERYGIEVEVFQGPSLGRQADAARRPAVGARARPLLRPAQGPPARARARGRRRLDLRRPARPVAEPRRHGQARLGRAPRALEGEPAGRLDREGRLGLHLRARPAVQPAARPRLRLDRLHALHQARRRPRRALDRLGEIRVRAARLSWSVY